MNTAYSGQRGFYVMDEDFSEASRSPLYVLNFSKTLSPDNVKVRIYSSRISIVKSSKFGFWEHKETYPLMDIGDIVVNKGMIHSTIIVKRRNTHETLFTVESITNKQAENLKQILNMMILKVQKALIQPEVHTSSRQYENFDEVAEP